MICCQGSCFGEACVVIPHFAGSTQVRPRITLIRQMGHPWWANTSVEFWGTESQPGLASPAAWDALSAASRTLYYRPPPATGEWKPEGCR